MQIEPQTCSCPCALLRSQNGATHSYFKKTFWMSLQTKLQLVTSWLFTHLLLDTTKPWQLTIGTKLSHEWLASHSSHLMDKDSGLPWLPKDKAFASNAVLVFLKVMQLTVSNTKMQLPMDSLLLACTCTLAGALLMLVGAIFLCLALQVARNGKIAFKLFI